MLTQSTGIRRAAPVVVVAALLTGACSQALYRSAVITDQLATMTSRIQDTEILLHDDGIISDRDHREWQEAFVKIGTGLGDIGDAIRTGSREDRRAKIVAVIDLFEALERDHVVGLEEDQRVLLSSLIFTARTMLATLSGIV